MTETGQTAGKPFPFPRMGYTYPSSIPLRHWAGIPARVPLSYSDVGKLRETWREAMQREGYCLAWVRPERGEIVSK